MWGQVSGKTEGMENVFPNNAQTSFNRSIMELGGQAEFNFFPYSDKFDYAGAKRFSPYVLVGIGLTVAPGGGKTFASPNIPLGVGMKYKIKNRLNLGCEFSFRKLFGDGLEERTCWTIRMVLRVALLRIKIGTLSCCCLLHGISAEVSYL